MSHAVVRGQPTAAQLYLDEIINAIIAEEKITKEYTSDQSGSEIKHIKNGVRHPKSLLLSEIIFYCMKKRQSDLLMTNARSGEPFTHAQILRKSISLARALTTRGARGKNVLFLMRNHENMVMLYYGTIFAGVVPMMLESSSTVYEIKYFIDLVDPFMIFCDEERCANVYDALKNFCNRTQNIIIANKPECMEQFIDNHSDDFETYKLPQASPDSTVMMLPTSGSTGLPKASHINNQGLVAQLPSLWTYHTEFPTPTRLIMLLSTPQWMTHTIVMTGSLVYKVPLVMAPVDFDPQPILQIIDKYQPSWTLFIPSFAPLLAAAAAPGQLDCFDTIIVTGSALPPHMKAMVEDIFSNCALLTGYGMTETQAFATLQSQRSPKMSVGKILNFLDFKIVDEDEQELGIHKTGELYLKSDLSVFKGYHKNEKEYQDCMTSDGWLKTGDLFYKDNNENLFYVTRKKFVITYFNHQISPEELERLIGDVPGVQESVVCGTERGAAAAVVVHPGWAVTRAQIHAAVAQLSKYKQLRGGVAFVDTLPRTHSGKVHRGDCARMLGDLAERDLCF